MFRDQAQRAKACLTLLTLFRLERFWNERPTNEAFEALDNQLLSSGELIYLRAALDIWSPGTGRAEIGTALRCLDTACSRALFTLLAAIPDGPDAIDQWIEKRKV